MSNTTANFNGFTATLDGKILTISKDGEQIGYDIPEKNEGIEQDTEFPEYFKIKTKNFYYSFKFEGDYDFVGDKFDYDDDFIDTFACHTFGE